MAGTESGRARDGFMLNGCRTFPAKFMVFQVLTWHVSNDRSSVRCEQQARQGGRPNHEARVNKLNFPKSCCPSCSTVFNLPDLVVNVPPMSAPGSRNRQDWVVQAVQGSELRHAAAIRFTADFPFYIQFVLVVSMCIV